MDLIQTIKVDLEKNKIRWWAEGRKDWEGPEPGLINDKRETSNQSIKLSSTHAVWKGRIWWVISIDKDKQARLDSLNLCLSQGPGNLRVAAELDTQLAESAIYQSESSSVQLVLFMLQNKYRDNGKVACLHGGLICWISGVTTT